jgi:hypothetical protein
MSDEARLEISLGPDTEQFINEIFRALDDETVDQVELDKANEADGVAREPVTATAVLIFAAPLLYAIVPVIDRLLEHGRQRHHMHLIYQAAQDNPAAVEPLTRLAEKHADVSIGFQPIRVKR